MNTVSGMKNVSGLSQAQSPHQQPSPAMYSEGPNFSGSVHYSSPHQQAIQAMNIVLPSSTNHLSQPSYSSVWLANTGATNHMSADLSNLSLITPYPANDRVQTANGEGLMVSHVGTSIIPTSTTSIKLNLVLYVPQLKTCY